MCERTVIVLLSINEMVEFLELYENVGVIWQMVGAHTYYLHSLAANNQSQQFLRYKTL